MRLFKVPNFPSRRPLWNNQELCPLLRWGCLVCDIWQWIPSWCCHSHSLAEVGISLSCFFVGTIFFQTWRPVPTWRVEMRAKHGSPVRATAFCSSFRNVPLLPSADFQMTPEERQLHKSPQERNKDKQWKQEAQTENWTFSIFLFSWFHDVNACHLKK